jgi:hypothetical protein
MGVDGVTYRFSHGNNSAIRHIQDSILFKDWCQHGLYYNAGAWAANVAALLMQFLGEEVNTQIAVLASGT